MARVTEGNMMSEFKGTKGPWFEHREGSSTVYVEAKLRDGVIQEVAACGPTEAGSEAQSANARLIAAAPDLLEALIAVVRVADRATDEFDMARAAIAKALGETK
jgi:hypothetical protein